MLALFNNFSLVEIAFAGVIAILVFGKRLPEVAGKAAYHVSRLRKAVEDMRRESGIEQEIREVKDTFQNEMNARVHAEEVKAAAAERIAKEVEYDDLQSEVKQGLDPDSDQLEGHRRLEQPNLEQSDPRQSDASSAPAGAGDAQAPGAPSKPDAPSTPDAPK